MPDPSYYPKAILGEQLQALAEDIDKDKVSRKAYQSSDFSDWNEFETTGVYEICGQVSGVQNSPESGRMTLYVTRSTTASTGRFFVTQLAVGNHVYKRGKAYKRTEGSVDIYEWSAWSIIDGDVTYTLSGSSDVGFNEMKDVFAKTGNIAVLVGEAIGNYTYLERFPLTDVEYSNGSISEFVFSRSRPHDDGTPSAAGTVDYYKLSSSGWSSGSYSVGYAREANHAVNASTADWATTAGSATRAVGDANGNSILTTYATIPDLEAKRGMNNMVAYPRSYSVWTQSGSLVANGTTDSDISIQNALNVANNAGACHIHMVLSTNYAGGDLVAFQYTSQGTESLNFKPGRRYVLTIQNPSQNAADVILNVGGRVDSIHLYDCWSIYHDGKDDVWINDIDNLNTHTHKIGTVNGRSWKSWEIMCTGVYDAGTWNVVHMVIATID